MTDESRDIFDRIREEYTCSFIGETVPVGEYTYIVNTDPQVPVGHTYFIGTPPQPEYIPGGRDLPPRYADLHLDAEARSREIHRLVGMGQIDDANALRAVQSLVMDRIHGVWADDRALVGPLRENPMVPTELSNYALAMASATEARLRSPVTASPRYVDMAWHPTAPTELSNQGLAMGKGLASGPKYALDAPPSPVVVSKDDMLPWITKMLHVKPEGLKQLQAELVEWLDQYDV